MVGMFGAYRWLLAAFVANSHLGYFHHIGGAYSVYGFFVLSGYLMTLTYRERYAHGIKGAAAFYLNRVLRIFPLYWLGIVTAYAFLQFLPDAVFGYEITIPNTPARWFANVALVGLLDIDSGSIMSRHLLSVSWSLLPEMMFYFALPLLLASRYVYMAWLALSLLFFTQCISNEQEFASRYFSIYGWMPAFAAGSFIYFLRQKFPPIPHWVMAPVLVAWLVFTTFPYNMSSDPAEIGFYTVFMLNILIVYYLSFQSAKSAWWQKADTFLGHVAYPIFVAHILVGVAVHAAFGDLLPLYGIPFFMVCIIITSALGYVLHSCIESPINRLRNTIR